jgi:hypothetical protein
MPQDPRREQIVGTFYTVEDLMNLPEAECVDPAKAREVSRNRPVRFWMETSKLVAILEANIDLIEQHQARITAEEARQADLLIAQRRLWVRHLVDTEEEETFIGLFPASFAGDEYDQEEAVTE